MVGFGANRRGARLPSFILIAMMVVILILSFNYWTVSNKHGRLLDELAEVQTQVKRTDAARSRLEKRNSELMVQVDAHRKQIDQKDGDVSSLEGKLRTREAQIHTCADEKGKLQNDVTTFMSENQRLKEQLNELRQEFLKQEEQLREVKRNSTYLERKLEYESLQCGRQIAQLKEEYEEKRKTLEGEVSRLKQTVLEHGPGKAAGGHADGVKAGEAAGERHTVANQQRDSPELKAGMGKPGSDAGMPGIEDSEVGKVEELQFALKKPAITQGQQGHGGEVVAKDDRAGAGAGAGAGDPALEHPDLQQDGAPLPGAPLQGVMVPDRLVLPHMQMQQQPPAQPVADRPVLFDEDSKARLHADELGESQRQLRAPDSMKADGFEVKGVGLPLPPNPAQVLPNPMDPQHARDAPPGQLARHRQSESSSRAPQTPGGKPHIYSARVTSWFLLHLGRFFDENESPVDPQHGSKLADYNGDDGNVGEYEADKQAELAYNEEEDGDGGEEDVQDDEDRELQGDRPADYGKRHQAIDIL
ncbi:hypothetical protein AGOR_G00163920 [Albula goreensis]|uniref:Protein GOLM2 n=1 Tax=Albula goreensis TaxID=1534307 RepID=A0A8T3D0S6_9TELE|nr:hypothetical protein AGOR_G00163920 [Albula goreensis]